MWNMKKNKHSGKVPESPTGAGHDQAASASKPISLKMLIEEAVLRDLRRRDSFIISLLAAAGQRSLGTLSTVGPASALKLQEKVEAKRRKLKEFAASHGAAEKES